jgi:hypothetical protein
MVERSIADSRLLLDLLGYAARREQLPDRVCLAAACRGWLTRKGTGKWRMTKAGQREVQLATREILERVKAQDHQ